MYDFAPLYNDYFVSKGTVSSDNSPLFFFDSTNKISNIIIIIIKQYGSKIECIILLGSTSVSTVILLK